MKSYMSAGVALVALLAGAAPLHAQKSKDTLRYPLASAESVLDPYLNPGSFHYTWAPAVYDNLLGFDPKKGEFVPHIAKGWTQPNPATYEFELRDDIKFHDGQALTVDDVVYTLNYLIDPKVNLRYKSNWAWIQSVEKLGPNKVRVTAKHPVPDGLMWLAGSTPIYPEHVHGPLDNKLDFGTKPVGTGNYRVTKLDKNSGIYAERNPNYVPSSIKPTATIGKIIAEPIPDSGTLVAALMTGKVDIAEDIPPDQASDMASSGKYDVTLAPPSLNYAFLGFPTAAWQNVKPLGDVRVRLAIAKAIDRKAMLDAVYGPLAKLLQPQEALCSKEQLGCGYTKLVPDYDPAGAKKLLAEAGYADGFDVAISCFPMDVTEVTTLAGMLRAVGIRATVKTHPIAQRVQLLSAGKVELGYYGWSGGAVFEVSGQIARHFGGKEYDDPTLIKMADATFSMMDDTARRKAVAEVFDYTTDHAYAFAMLPIRRVFTHSKDVKLNAADEMRATSVAVSEFSWK